MAYLGSLHAQQILPGKTCQCAGRPVRYRAVASSTRPICRRHTARAPAPWTRTSRSHFCRDPQPRSSPACQASAVEEAAPPAEAEASVRTFDGAGPGPQQNSPPRYQEGRPKFEKPIIENPAVKVGDIVTGRVVWSGERGSKVALDIDPRIRGFLPQSHTPLQLRETMERAQELQMYPSLKREYVVLQVPEKVEANGRGPLISAKAQDMDVFWKRAHQMAALCAEDQEFVRVKISYANRGGLIAMLASLVIFIPFSRIPKSPGARLSMEDLDREWSGKDVDVAIESVEPENNKVVGSITTANMNRLMRRIQVGALLWTHVHTVQSFGVFLTIEGTTINGLLHVSNISRVRVDTPDQVFQPGDRVRAIIIGMEKSYQRISFSTAELEENEGDMLEDQERVYAGAEVQADTFRQALMQSQEAGNALPAEFTPRKQERRQQRRNNDYNDGGYNDNADDFQAGDNDIWGS